MCRSHEHSGDARKGEFVRDVCIRWSAAGSGADRVGRPGWGRRRSGGGRDSPGAEGSRHRRRRRVPAARGQECQVRSRERELDARDRLVGRLPLPPGELLVRRGRDGCRAKRPLPDPLPLPPQGRGEDQRVVRRGVPAGLGRRRQPQQQQDPRQRGRLRHRPHPLEPGVCERCGRLRAGFHCPRGRRFSSWARCHSPSTGRGRA